MYANYVLDLFNDYLSTVKFIELNKKVIMTNKLRTAWPVLRWYFRIFPLGLRKVRQKRDLSRIKVGAVRAKFRKRDIHNNKEDCYSTVTQGESKFSSTSQQSTTSFNNSFVKIKFKEQAQWHVPSAFKSPLMNPPCYWFSNINFSSRATIKYFVWGTIFFHPLNYVVWNCINNTKNL